MSKPQAQTGSTARSIMLDAIILCGGRGSRLASIIADVPKPLAPVAEKPVLDYLLHLLAQSGGVRSATLAVHHLAERIVSYYAEHTAPLPLRFVREQTPLGTGGAIMNCLSAVEGPTFLCLNGDSLCGGDLAALIETHRTAAAGISVALIEMADTSRYGRVGCESGGGGADGAAWKAPPFLSLNAASLCGGDPAALIETHRTAAAAKTVAIEAE